MVIEGREEREGRVVRVERERERETYVVVVVVVVVVGRQLKCLVLNTF